MRSLVVLVFLLLTACAPLRVDPSAGRYFTIGHAFPRFEAAMDAAQKHCAKMGMQARHLGTDRAGAPGNLSRFECVPRVD
jgi:hypothetical protein